MPVIEQIGNQATCQRCRQKCHIAFSGDKSGSRKEHHHRYSHTAAKTIHTVGQVDGVHAAHHHEHREKYIQKRMDINGLIHKGNVQIAGDHIGLHQYVNEDRRNRHLKQSLLNRGQSQISLEFRLEEIIQKAHKTKAQSKCQYIKHGKISPGRNGQQQTSNGSNNEH